MSESIAPIFVSKNSALAETRPVLRSTAAESLLQLLPKTASKARGGALAAPHTPGQPGRCA